MKDVRNDAARLVLLHGIGAIPQEEIIRWADALIASEEKPAYELIALSTAPVGDVSDSLRVLARGADVWGPVEAALPAMLEFVCADPTRAPIVARALYHVAVSQQYQVPEPLRFILGAEDDFDLARDGVFHFDEVYRSFIEDIRLAITLPKNA